jgi:DNA-binding PadR family transcriptional regulator
MNVKTLCLGILSCGDASGYEIKQFFEEAFSHFYAAGYGSIYPALAELNQAGLIDGVDVIQEKRPAKKVYSLTPVGRAQLLNELAQTEPSHKIRSAFMVLMVFSSLLSRERLKEVLHMRMDESQQMIDYIKEHVSGHEDPAARFVGGFAMAALRAGKEYIEQHQAQFLKDMHPTNPPESKL